MSTTTPKPAAKRVKTAIPAPAAPVAEYRMPTEVADWVKQAEARIAYLTTRVAELKADNAALKHSHRLMEQRVLGQSQE
jgi:hypothetical protein